jgi:hypothetical protein
VQTPLELPTAFWVVLASELVAAWLIWRLWRSREHVFFKIALSLIALVPVLGPLVVMWVGNFPSAMPPILRDQRRYRTDLYDRWRHVLEATSEKTRYRRWRTLMTRHRNEDP